MIYAIVDVIGSRLVLQISGSNIQIPLAGWICQKRQRRLFVLSKTRPGAELTCIPHVFTFCVNLSSQHQSSMDTEGVLLRFDGLFRRVQEEMEEDKETIETVNSLMVVVSTRT